MFFLGFMTFHERKRIIESVSSYRHVSSMIWNFCIATSHVSQLWSVDGWNPVPTYGCVDISSGEVCVSNQIFKRGIYVFLFHHSHETVLGFLNNCVPEKCRIWTVNNRTFHSPMMWHVRDIMWTISSWDAMKIHNMYLHVHWFFGMFQIFWTTKWMRGMLSLTSLYCKKYAKRRTFASSCTNYNILVNTTQQPILHIYIYI